MPAPAWREGEADWVAHEDQFDASILAGEREGRRREALGVRARRRRRPTRTRSSSRRRAPTPTRTSARAGASRRIRSRVGPCARARRATSRARPLTGIVLAAVVFAVFLAGPLPLHGARPRRARASRPPRPTPAFARSGRTPRRSSASSRCSRSASRSTTRGSSSSARSPCCSSSSASSGT